MTVPIDASAVTFLQFIKAKNELKRKTAEVDGYKALLLKHAQEAGEKDDKGSYYAELSSPLEIEGKTYHGMKKTRRVTQEFNTRRAEELLAEKGLYDPLTHEQLEILLQKVAEEFLAENDLPVDVKIDVNISQSAVYKLYCDGMITEEDMVSLIDETETWAFNTVE